MPKTSLEKTRKAIAKKKGPIDAIHQFSRDSKRLHRAQARDEKLEKIASARRKVDKPLIERASYFQEAAKQNGGKALEASVIQELINAFVHQYDEELNDLKKNRRPGRPATTREDLLKVKIASLEKEYENGFFLPDLSIDENAAHFTRWDGAWSFLTTLKWVRLSRDGKSQPSSFPPKGNN
ncbi:translation machinery-associated protein 16 [Xylariales sp. PMI_506]|nr:translation machinery-associated protein 16 [Xylariales sp. PMI_506]